MRRHPIQVQSLTMIPYVESGLLWVECQLEEHLLAVGERQG